MNSSVKFLEPTLTVTSPLEDLLAISFPLLPLLLDPLSLLSSPHAATSTAPASAAIAAIRARAKLRLISARSYFVVTTQGNFGVAAYTASRGNLESLRRH